MARVIITTTGTQNPVTFNDLGGRRYFHPTTDYDLTNEFTLDEIAFSNGANCYFS